MRKKTFGDDDILNNVNGEKTLVTKGRYDNDSIEDLKKDFLVEIEELEGASSEYISKEDLEILILINGSF